MGDVVEIWTTYKFGSIEAIQSQKLHLDAVAACLHLSLSVSPLGFSWFSDNDWIYKKKEGK